MVSEPDGDGATARAPRDHSRGRPQIPARLVKLAFLGLVARLKNNLTHSPVLAVAGGVAAPQRYTGVSPRRRALPATTILRRLRQPISETDHQLAHIPGLAAPEQ